MNTKRSYQYDKDFYAWALHNAALIRHEKFSEIDFEHVAEEIESMAKSDKRELISRLAVLLAHLLKWKYQPSRRGNSWRLTIKMQRLSTTRLLKQSPSLKHDITKSLNDAYKEGILLAASETDLKESHFPKHCPFTLKQCLEINFFPE